MKTKIIIGREISFSRSSNIKFDGRWFSITEEGFDMKTARKEEFRQHCLILPPHLANAIRTDDGQTKIIFYQDNKKRKKLISFIK